MEDTFVDACEVLREWIPPPHIHSRLLYRATRDGFTAKAFHERCDGEGPRTVTVSCTFWCHVEVLTISTCLCHLHTYVPRT